MIEDLIGKKYTKYLNEAVNIQHEAAYYVNRDSENPYHSTFRNIVLSVYNDNKLQTNRFFEAFLGNSIPSLEVCKTIFTNLFKVFDSQNQNAQYNFTNASYKQDAEQFLKKFEKFWQNEYWEAVKAQFNSLIVVDLPIDQKTNDPDPYLYILDISRVVGITPDKDLNIDEIVFTENVEIEVEGKKVEKVYYYYYTKEFYSKWEKAPETNVYINIFTIPHNLKENPCFFLWPSTLNQTSWILREGILVPIFDDLKWYNIKYVESRKADMLYLNPIMQRIRSSCGYDSSLGNHVKDSNQSIKCSNGWLVDEENRLIINNGNRVLCPVCGKGKHGGGGAGNIIEIDINEKPEDVDVSKPLASFITPPIEGTIEQFNRLPILKDSIIESACGTESAETREAINEKQVKYNTESKEDVLKRAASYVSYAVTNAYRRLLTLRYRERFISCSYFQGSEFYTKTIKDLIDLRAKAHNPIIKAQIDEQVIEVKYRNNPEKMSKEKLLYKLLPYSSLTDAEFLTQIGIRINDEKTINLRLQFTDAVLLFESKYGSIYEYYKDFSDSVPDINRIQVIKDNLLSLIKIEKNVIQDQVSKSF